MNSHDAVDVAAALPADLDTVLKAERPEDSSLVEALIERAFGPGSGAKPPSPFGS